MPGILARRAAGWNSELQASMEMANGAEIAATGEYPGTLDCAALTSREPEKARMAGDKPGHHGTMAAA